MPQVVEVLLSQTVSGGACQLLSHEGVVDDLQSLPVTLTLQELIHLFLGTAIAGFSDPSVELDQPNLLQEDLDVTG